MLRMATPALLCCMLLLAATPAFLPTAAYGAFVNWENAHVYPLDLTPDGNTLLAVNTADSRLEVFDLTSGQPEWQRSIAVGIDPVSVRARSNQEAWVVNHVSDSLSIVDLDLGHTIHTVTVGDEPADVVFAGTPERAFVTCSQTNQIWVLDPEDLDANATILSLEAEDPRALAVSADGSEVYAAIFESGNRSTILGGGIASTIIPLPLDFPPNVVNDANGPYGGVNPPENTEDGFEPAKNPSNPAPPRVGLVVKQDAAGRWLDDRGSDWSSLVSGSSASQSGRPEGWHLVDHDVAIIKSDTLEVRYAEGLMNIGMAISVHPQSGEVVVLGTDATNEVRFEPVLNGRFLRVLAARVDPESPSDSPVVLSIEDLNPHLDYSGPSVDPSERSLSLGDPRGLAWHPTGEVGYVTGMGSNNVIQVTSQAVRSELDSPIPVGEGPTGLVFDAARDQLYVLNKFSADISTVDTTSHTETSRTPFYDPSPLAIKKGRPHFYNTVETSGTGHVSCASCHIDGRMDRLAWDLGDPAGEMKSISDQNLGGFNILTNFGFKDFHPMKGPMLTQTMQDIIGKEPHHWRGDRDGIEEFNPAFEGLLGDDEQLSDSEMQEFEDFLATITFPPNPFRNFDNSLPTDLPLPGHFSTGRFAPAGEPLPNGNAERALEVYRFPRLADSFALACATCHTLPTGLGTNRVLDGFDLVDLEDGPNGEKHHALVSVDGSTNTTIKIAGLRNLYERVGLELTQQRATAGFGFLHDGSVDSLARFVAEPLFNLVSLQELADTVAFLLAFSGSELPESIGPPLETFEPVGPKSQDTHAAVGAQMTFTDGANAPLPDLERLDEALALARAGKVGLVAKGRMNGLDRGFVFDRGETFAGDSSGLLMNKDELIAQAAPGSEITFTVVPTVSAVRRGVDRDEDGFRDQDERAACSDPADPQSQPSGRLTLSGGPIVAGEPYTFEVRCAVPSSQFGFATSRVGLGVTITPAGELGIEQAQVLGTARVDETGGAVLTVTLPPGSAGEELWWQAIDTVTGEVTPIQSALVETP